MNIFAAVGAGLAGLREPDPRRQGHRLAGDSCLAFNTRAPYACYVELPIQVRRLVEAGTAIGHFATCYKDVPYVTPVWLDIDANTDHILIDVKPNAIKLRNVRSNRNVCL